MPSKIIMISCLVERLLNPELKRETKISDIVFAVNMNYIDTEDAIELALEYIKGDEKHE